MIIYSEMTEQQIQDYREKSIQRAKKEEESWKKRHSNKADVFNHKTPFDIVHDETPIAGLR